MKTNSTNANYVPAYRSKEERRSKLSQFISYLLPEDCKIETRSDFYYLCSIGFICVTFIFPPAIFAVAYCIGKARRKADKEKGGRK